jgi:6-phosphogluconate dehydrogenase
MEIGFVGLGKMGLNMVRRLAPAGHRVVAWDRSAAAVADAAGAGAVAADGLADLVRRLAPPRAVWVMVPSGDATESTVQALGEIMSPGDTLVDGGNSYYRDTLRRAGDLSARGVRFVDAGTSGGIWGLERGYCLMVGGDPSAIDHLRPAFLTLAPPHGFAHVGPSGAGHFAKMVHNGIEYGMLQAYAEGFEILEKSRFDFDMRAVTRLWNNGSVVRSWLLELAERAYAADPTLSTVRGYVEDSGEGRWTVQEAIDLNVPAPVITDSLLVRLRSRQDDSYAARVIAALRREFGGHAVQSAAK